jgi:ABC-type nitrate/sulfonate/bicarbonate transport system substrate-binding protein
MNKRFLLKATAALAAVAAFSTAQAQTTPIKFQLDWRFEGPAAFFLLPAAKGYFKDAKLDVTVDSGNGSGGAVTRVASGTYDLGFADVDAITGFTFTSLLNIEARGVKAEDVVVMQYPDFGVKLYGNAIIASPKILKENPAAVKAFLSAFTKGAKDVIADPAKAIESVKARDGIINVALETRRLQLAIDTVINSPSARAEGFGQINGPRMTLMASQVSDAFNTKTRVKSEDIWNGSFLPTAKELDILPKGKK